MKFPIAFLLVAAFGSVLRVARRGDPNRCTKAQQGSGKLNTP